jgi:hypothetical protein
VRNLARSGARLLRAALFRALRISGASVAAWLVAHALSPNSTPVLAPLTAVLVVQVTLTGTLWSGVERVVSVVAGVLLAVIFTAVIGLTWWSLGLLVAVSIIIGQLLKLGPNLVEVPISAMLVLAVGAGAAGQVATGRAYETLIGAIVGMAANVVFPPALRTLDAGARVEQFAVRIAGTLDDAAAATAAAALPGPISPMAHRWLDEARRLTRHVPAIDKEITDADEGRQLNLRALGTPRSSAWTRDGLEALERTLITIRSLFRAIADEMPEPDPDDPYPRQARDAFAVLLADLARCVRSFGAMVRAQAGTEPDGETAALSADLAVLREHRASCAEVLLRGPRTDPRYWEENVILLVTVERALLELDVEQYQRARDRYLAEQDAHPTHQAAERIRRRSRRLGEHLGEQFPDLGGRLPLLCTSAREPCVMPRGARPWRRPRSRRRRTGIARRRGGPAR